MLTPLRPKRYYDPTGKSSFRNLMLWRLEEISASQLTLPLFQYVYGSILNVINAEVFIFRRISIPKLIKYKTTWTLLDY